MEVEVKPHAFLNISKGVIRCSELDSVSIEEIKSELKSQKIKDVSRFTIRRNGETINTHSYLLTFGTPEVPKNIKVGYLSIPVKVYIPNPRRCTNCLLFGHIKSYCKKKEMTCSWCSKVRHEGSCENPIMCAVCKGAHNSFDKSCPAFIVEKEIKKIQVVEKVPYGAAKRKFNENAPQNLILRKPKYSEILSKTFNETVRKIDSGTQTDFHAPEPNTSESSTAASQDSNLLPRPYPSHPVSSSQSLPPPCTPDTPSLPPLPPSPVSTPPSTSGGKSNIEELVTSMNSPKSNSRKIQSNANSNPIIHNKTEKQQKSKKSALTNSNEKKKKNKEVNINDIMDTDELKND